MLSEGEKRVLLALYLNKQGLHLREICRLSKLTLPAVAKHIDKGEKSGAIVSKRIGQLKLCRFNFSSHNIVSIIQNIESERFRKLPHVVRDSAGAFLDELEEKPIIALIFGSYAKGNQTKKSDLDILLIFQRIDTGLAKSVEQSAAKIKGRTGVNIQPISLSYDEFEKNILNKENEFMKDIRKSALVLRGLELFAKLLGRFFG